MMGFLGEVLEHFRQMPVVNVPGVLRPTTKAEAIARAKRLCGTAGARIRYRLADHQGGRDPHADDCASHWHSLIKRIPLATSDCAGFVAWCLGFDRYQPKTFATYGGWINCDSALIDARANCQLFHAVLTPEPGDLVVFPSIDLDRDGKRDRYGHTGLVTYVGPRWTPGAWSMLRVAHCSSLSDQRFDRAIMETAGLVWARRENYRDQSNPAWASTFLRYRWFAPG